MIVGGKTLLITFKTEVLVGYVSDIYIYTVLFIM